MKNIFTAVAASTAIACSIATAANPMPRDVRRFIANSDNCEHLAGEWDSSLPQSEQRRIERDVVRYCDAARMQLRALRKKYRGHSQIEQILSDHANEAVTGFSK